MSQHDMEITTADANDFLTYRAAVNAAFQALASNNSGASFPAAPYANMFHISNAAADPVLYLRNNANDAWTTLFTITASGIKTNNDYINGVPFGLGRNSLSTNIAIGAMSLIAVSTGGYNTSVGRNSLNGITTGQRNSAFGYGAGNVCNGSDNTFLGYNAGAAMTTGNRNVVIGQSAARFTAALVSITTATNCIYIGSDVRPSASGNTNEIVIGDTAIGAGSNTATIGSSATVLTVLSGVIQKRALDTAPASATAAGTAGEIRVTATHIYVCTATNTWVRAALATW